MRKVIIDGKYMKTKEKTHIYLKDKLDICSYRGNNLDALWDALSTHSRSIEIELLNKEKLIKNLNSYGNSIIEVFEEAKNENSNINFKIIDK
ncbi:MAG: barstar family protein [Tissierella sp.]|uniref:barstar family protein n=1 Tax=Tissierella sp. TaxID=41274 RepID=UPI003F957AB1